MRKHPPVGCGTQPKCWLELSVRACQAGWLVESETKDFRRPWETYVVTVLFLAQHESQNNKSPEDPPFTAIGYRDYVDYRNAGDADENLKRFRQLLLSFKDNDANALHYFLGLLEIIFEKVIGRVDLITCVPGHEKTPRVRIDPLARLVEQVAKKMKCRNGSSVLQRTVSQPPAHQDPRQRSFARQFESIHAEKVPRDHDIERILIIDDIYSSGKSMAACYSHLRHRFASAEVVGFAFGRTTSTPMVRWPQTPDFPRRDGLEQRLATVLRDLRREAKANKDFSRDKGIVMGRWNQKIHRLTCRYLPIQYFFLESVSQGISEGGQRCGVCRPRDIN